MVKESSKKDIKEDIEKIEKKFKEFIINYKKNEYTIPLNTKKTPFDYVNLTEKQIKRLIEIDKDQEKFEKEEGIKSTK
jgi:hypothetical protein